MSKTKLIRSTDETITTEDMRIDRLEELLALCKGLPFEVGAYDHAQTMWDSVSESTQNFITNGRCPGIDIESPEGRCNLLIDLRICCHMLLHGLGLRSPQVRIRLDVDERRKVVVTMPFLFRLLDRIDVDRIRLCLHCKSVFYARRRNKKMCSPACGNVSRVQKSRREAAKKSAEYAARPGKVATKGARYKRDYRNSPGAKRARKNRNKHL